MMSPGDHTLFRQICNAAETFVLVTHIHPDGDAIGSQISLGRFLASSGKQVRIINNDPAPRTLDFLDRGGLTLEHYDPSVHDQVLGDADMIVLVDNSAPDRLGRLEPMMHRLAAGTLCIDHHPTREAPWKFNIVNVGFCATTAMVYELVTSCGWKLDTIAAEAIYVGLVTDTGYFRFNSTNVRCHQIAAELLGFGVQPARAYQQIYERNSVAFTRLLGHALSGLRLDAGSSIASVKITHQLIETLQAEDVDTSEITTALLAMDGVRVAILFRELPDGKIKVSLRSKGQLDVHRLAVEFGGGGHRNASGIVMAERLEQVVRVVTDRATALVASEPAEHQA